jgi:hypothetical protein
MKKEAFLNIKYEVVDDRTVYCITAGADGEVKYRKEIDSSAFKMKEKNTPYPDNMEIEQAIDMMMHILLSMRDIKLLKSLKSS